MGIILMPQQLAPLPQQVATTSPADQQSARSPAPSTATRCQHPASCCPISRRPAGGPARALPAPSQPSALKAHRRPLPAPAGSEQGATGGFARRASGTLPQITRPKTGKRPLVFRGVRVSGVWQWGVLRGWGVSQWLAVGPGFLSLPSREIRGTARVGRCWRSCSLPVLFES